MNALTSYLRHLFVTGILILIEKLKLPLEGAEAAANYIALAIIGTLSWLFVKYVAPRIKIPKGSGVALFALAVALSLSNISCTVSLGANGRPQVGVDPYSAKQVIRGITNKVNAKIVDYSK